MFFILGILLQHVLHSNGGQDLLDTRRDAASQCQQNLPIFLSKYNFRCFQKTDFVSSNAMKSLWFSIGHAVSSTAA